MDNIKVSLFASSVRPKLYPAFFKSLESTSVEFEVVFAGPDLIAENMAITEQFQNFDYILTHNIKPAQCYEVARRRCRGETVVWVADDCEFPNDVIGKAYKYWKEKNNEKLILSIQTKESGYGLPQGALYNMANHTFFGFDKFTPLMAPLGLMSREYLNDLGGIDRRYVCGQYENDIVMRLLADGGKVEIFGDENCFIDIDHLGKSIAIGESKVESDFLKRPFASGYEKDRQVLEGSWARGQGRMSIVNGKYSRRDEFQPYDSAKLLTETQSNTGRWS